MYASVSGAIINLILNYVFIRIFGYVAAAYTTLFCYIFFSAAHYMIMREICKKELDDIKLFDVHFIVVLGLLVLAITIGFSFVYRNRLIRYSVIAILITVMILNRKTILSSISVITHKGDEVI